MVFTSPDTIIGKAPAEASSRVDQQTKTSTKAENTTLNMDLESLAALLRTLEITLPTLPVRSRQG